MNDKLHDTPISETAETIMALFYHKKMDYGDMLVTLMTATAITIHFAVKQDLDKSLELYKDFCKELEISLYGADNLSRELKQAMEE